MQGKDKKRKQNQVTATYGVAITARFSKVPSVHCDTIISVIHANADDPSCPRWRSDYAMFGQFRDASIFAIESGASQITVFYATDDSMRGKPGYVVEMPFDFDNLIRETTDTEEKSE